MQKGKRQALWATVLVISAIHLAGCQRGGMDRLTGGTQASSDIPAGPPADPHTGNPADPGVPGDPGTLPTPPAAPENPSAPVVSSTSSSPRIETYQFEGYVIAGGTLPAGVGVGDKVSGTFRINLDKSMVAEFPNRGVYLALEAIQGTAGPETFAGGADYIYVGDHQSLACAMDTAYMNLNGATINYDFFFFLPDGDPFFTTHSLDNLHNLDQRLYRRVDLWFETDPRNGTGFNADIYAFHRIDGPAQVAMAAMNSKDYVNVRW